ncbi:MAG: glucosaminidase domain-containing protein [Saprospiraceae bacterium]|nr:glucosaminidase domain-containing protein [Saprospiraceae bacterium]
MFKYLIVFTLSLFIFTSFHSSPENAAFEYIEQYKDLAVVEMYRTGIPASVTLAQGLHESNYGMSKLAIEANNHFGIKCKSYWTGKTYFHKDDDLNKEGNLIESCFRAYRSTVDSYVDRSNFLMQSDRYKILFEYASDDYMQWIYGLKACGYATDPQYAEKLIDKIIKYDLHQYDKSEDPFRHLITK